MLLFAILAERPIGAGQASLTMISCPDARMPAAL
jgi:hypothetical protein